MPELEGGIPIYPRFIYGKTAGGEKKLIRVDEDGALANPLQESTLHASAAETETVTGPDVLIEHLKAANFYLDVTAVSGTAPTLDVTIQEKDPASGVYFDILTFTQATGVTSQRSNYGSGPGELLGKIIRFVATIAGTTPSFTFSLSMVGKS